MAKLWTQISVSVATLALAGAVSAFDEGGQQEPGMERQEPGMEQQREPGPQQEPGMEQRDPGAQQQQPGMEQQEPGPQQQQPGMAEPEPDQPTFSEDQIDNFVDAYLEIVEIQEAYTAQIEDSESADAARELQEEANDEMVSAIENNGLSVPEYSEIANAMDMDPQLRDRVSSLIHERR